MTITATIKNNFQHNDIIVATGRKQNNINIPAKPNGKGFAVNGGELLFLSIATCLANNIHAESSQRNININSMVITVSGEFDMEDETTSNISCKVEIQSDTPKSEIIDLINYVDKVASIHNTLRKGAAVSIQVEL